MKFLVCLVLLVGPVLASESSIKIVYGADDRIDVRDVTNAQLLEVASSTAAMIPQWKLDTYNNPETPEFLRLMLTLSGSTGVCPTERFADQPALASCSGFLVGDKTIVTAGHCVSEFAGCDGKVWVFDYNLDSSGTESVTIDPANVYNCAKVVRSVLNLKSKLDYAVVELDRVVEGRQPLKFRKRGKIKSKTPLIVIGHPSGVPTKIAGGAKVLRQKRNYFGADLDTFGGNSGSAVFNAKTLEVEGILVRGDEDYITSADGCRAVNVRSKPKGSEEVTRITKVKEIQ